jgi:hypothetical protein
MKKKNDSPYHIDTTKIAGSPVDVQRDAQRVLAAVYRLSRGAPGITLEQADVFAEVEREQLLSLSDEEFKTYLSRIEAEVAEWRARHVR